MTLRTSALPVIRESATTRSLETLTHSIEAFALTTRSLLRTALTSVLKRTSSMRHSLMPATNAINLAGLVLKEMTQAACHVLQEAISLTFLKGKLLGIVELRHPQTGRHLLSTFLTERPTY